MEFRYNNPPSMTRPSWLTTPLIAIVTAGALLFGGLILFMVNNGVTNTGNKLESQLSATYNSGAATLSACQKKTANAVGVTKAQSAALDKIIADAASGRYGAGAQINEKAILGAIVEAYPNLSGLDKSFQDAMVIITGCQDDFLGAQKDVQDKVREFNSWRTGSWTARTFGSEFPNENLYVRLPGINLNGQAALDKISMPIVDTVTSEAYVTGEQELNDPFSP